MNQKLRALLLLALCLVSASALSKGQPRNEAAEQTAQAVLDDSTAPAEAAARARALLGKTLPPATRTLASSANTRGYRLYQQGKLDDALSLFVVAAELDASYGMPRYNAARVLAVRADASGAMKWLRELKAMGRSQSARLAEVGKDAAFAKIWGSPELAALLAQESVQPTETPSTSARILVPEQYHDTQLQLSHPEKQSWLGICAERDGTWLRSVEVSIARTNDALVDGDSARTGKTVVVHGCEHAVLVLTNLPTGSATVPRRLPTATLAPETKGELPRPTRLLFGGEKYTVDPVEKQIRSVGGVDFFDSRIYLRRGARSSVLVAYDDIDAPPRSIDVKWAGDLDGDGKLDVLLSEDCVDTPQTHLYLSAATTGDELVKEVAATTRGGD